MKISRCDSSRRCVLYARLHPPHRWQMASSRKLAFLEVLPHASSIASALINLARSIEKPFSIPNGQDMA